MSFTKVSFENLFELYYILIFLIVILTFKLVLTRQQFVNLPPGPKGIPFLGHLLFLKDPVEQITNLGKRYGDVFKLHLLGKDYVVLNSYNAIKEAFIKQSDNFAGRSQEFNLFWELNRYKSLLALEGDKWRVFHKIFNDFFRERGVGTQRFEDNLEDILTHTIENINLTKGNPFDFYETLTNVTYNTVSSFAFNEYHSVDDKIFLLVINSMRTYFKSCPNMDMFLYGTWARRLKHGFLNKNWKAYSTALKSLYGVIEEKIADHKETFDKTYIRDYIDAVIHFRNENKDIEITDQEFAANVHLFFVAGTETTSTTLYFALYYLTANEQIQTKCREEIYQMFGSERFPSYLSKETCPYFNAFISEVHRFSGVIPFSAPHANKRTTELMGYTIPARTIILPNLYAAMRDEKYFTKPNEFDPQHFLDENGDYKANDALVPYSIGKRICPGRGAANIQMFIILARLLQKFDLIPPTNDEMPVLKIFNGITRIPLPFKIRAIKR